jgi:hypothetical protein
MLALQTHLGCGGTSGPVISHTHHFPASWHGEVLVQVWLLGRYPGRMSATGRIRVARVYDDLGPADGERILVDKLWPRGFRKDDPRVGIWFKDIAS